MLKAALRVLFGCALFTFALIGVPTSAGAEEEAGPCVGPLMYWCEIVVGGPGGTVSVVECVIYTEIGDVIQCTTSS